MWGQRIPLSAAALENDEDCVHSLQIAAIFEFTGAIVLGRVSTATIAGGIADVGVIRTRVHT